jgi:hypothetical protein
MRKMTQVSDLPKWSPKLGRVLIIIMNILSYMLGATYMRFSCVLIRTLKSWYCYFLYFTHANTERLNDLVTVSKWPR